MLNWFNSAIKQGLFFKLFVLQKDEFDPAKWDFNENIILFIASIQISSTEDHFNALELCKCTIHSVRCA